MFVALHVPDVRIEAFTAVLKVIFAKDLALSGLVLRFGFASTSFFASVSLFASASPFAFSADLYDPHFTVCFFYTARVNFSPPHKNVPFRLFAPFHFRIIIALPHYIQRSTIVVRKRNGNLILTATVMGIVEVQQQGLS